MRRPQRVEDAGQDRMGLVGGERLRLGLLDAAGSAGVSHSIVPNARSAAGSAPVGLGRGLRFGLDRGAPARRTRRAARGGRAGRTSRASARRGLGFGSGPARGLRPARAPSARTRPTRPRAPARAAPRSTASGSGSGLVGLRRVDRQDHSRTPPRWLSRTVPLARSASHSTRDRGPLRGPISPNSPRWRDSRTRAPKLRPQLGGRFTRVREASERRHARSSRRASHPSCRPSRGLLTAAQRLGGPEREDGASVPEVVRLAGGLQAQDAPGPPSAYARGSRARRPRPSTAPASRALDRPDLVHARTLHLVAAEDARWLVALLGPVGRARGRRRREQMGIGAEATAAVRAEVADGPRTRHELAGHVHAAAPPSRRSAAPIQREMSPRPRAT